MSIQTLEDYEIKEIMEENGVEITTNPKEAIWCLRDGTMVSGLFDCGIRGSEHREFAELMVDEYDRYSPNGALWSALHESCEVIMIVPESEEILIMEDQELTDPQISLVEKLGYEICEYCEPLKQLDNELAR